MISIFCFQSSHATVAQVACDSLLLLCDKADVLLELYPNVPSKIIQVRYLRFDLKDNKEEYIMITYFLFRSYRIHLGE